MKILRILSYIMILTNMTADSLKMSQNVPYWFNPKIHNFGNIGIGGKIHAKSAEFFTKMIDIMAYNNTDIRNDLLVKAIPNSYSVCDFGCGVGLSTHAGENSIGIDTSNEMISMAKQNFPDKKFEVANAETYGHKNQFDISTISFLFHEVPQEGRIKIIKNALRISKYGVIIMDISPQYQPSKQMLSGEPYILEYCKNINFDINKIKYEKCNMEVAPGRANIWIISKLKNSFLTYYKQYANENIKNYQI